MDPRRHARLLGLAFVQLVVQCARRAPSDHGRDRLDLAGVGAIQGRLSVSNTLGMPRTHSAA